MWRRIVDGEPIGAAAAFLYQMRAQPGPAASVEQPMIQLGRRLASTSHENGCSRPALK